MTVGTFGARPWWPFDIDCTPFVARIDRLGPVEGLTASPLPNDRVDFLALSEPEVLRVIESDSLPIVAHYINGWGRAENKEIDRVLASFLQVDTLGRHFFLQRHPEGDVHPWQTFAYLLMSGTTLDEIPDGWPCSLEDAVQASLELNTSDGDELGHLFYTLSHARFLKDPGGGVLLNGSATSIDALVDMGFRAHVGGHFEVCRKFHLTEGLLSISRTSRYRPFAAAAQSLLSSQLDLAVLLAISHLEILAGGTDDLFFEVSRGAALGSLFVNHLYAVGHLTELAGIAIHAGYNLEPLHVNALRYLDFLFERYLAQYRSRLIIPRDLYQLGHYRRGALLFRRSGLREVAPEDMAAVFIPPSIAWEFVGGSALDDPVLGAAASLFNDDNPGDFRAVGSHAHFRRVHMPGWPRGAHYEILERDGQYSVDLHLEGGLFGGARNMLEPILADLAKQLGRKASYEPNWYPLGQRLYVPVEEATPRAMHGLLIDLIARTFHAVDPIVSLLRYPASEVTAKSPHLFAR